MKTIKIQMTKKDKLIDMLLEHQINCNKTINRDFTIKIFDIINECDWKIFCSQMGDYDHPMERVNAKKEMERKLKELNPYDMPLMAETIKMVKNDLSVFGSKIERYYSNNFHTLNEIA